jgi:uncharacterized repeat protein (TIGR01451 family)
MGRQGLVFCGLFLRILLFPAVAVAQVPPAGQVITSQSIATFDENGSRLNVASNEVSLIVLAIYGPVLLPDGTTSTPANVAYAFSGERVTFPYYLTNTGNDDDTFELAVSFEAPSDFVPSLTEVYLDLDGDSLIDPGEPLVTNVGPLLSGEGTSLVLAADLPMGLTGGEVAHLDLSARSIADTSLVDEGNIVRIIARDEARVELVKSASNTSMMPGDNVTFTVAFSNTGERDATNVIISDPIDSVGNTAGAVYLAGSATATPSGTIEYFDETTGSWVDIAPPADRVKGVRLLLASVAPGETGSLEFGVSVPSDMLAGTIYNTASTDFTGGDGRPYALQSNEVAVQVGRISTVYLGPPGYPTADEGGPDDRNLIMLNAVDTVYTFWHELLNAGNFTDTLQIGVIDSVLIPSGWQMTFIDTTGSPLPQLTTNRAYVGPVAVGGSRIVGLRIESTSEGFRAFPGRELAFLVEGRSLVDTGAFNTVQDIFAKTDLPLLSIVQTIREPVAQVGDVLSCVITIENITDETTVDSLIVIENLSPGLGFAGGNDIPEISGNVLTWNAGSLGPGEKNRLVFRARVKAGQEWNRLVNNAWVYGVSELGEQVSDGPAQASIKIVEGIFTRRGIVLGGVFVDDDADGLWGENERGLPGVSVFIEDGTYAVSDSAGLYSIPGVEEGPHVVRVDPSTLPDSLAPGLGSYFDLGSAEGRLVVMPPSGNRTVYFPVVRRGRNERSAGEISGQAESDPQSSGDARTADPGSASSGSSLATGGTGGPAENVPSAELSADSDTAKAFEAITIPGSHFREGSAYLEEIPISRIASLSLWVGEHPGWRVFITGHTDSVPISTSEFPSNFELSVARARSVYQLLRMNGIPEDRMDYMGYGSRMPLAPNGTEEGRTVNRRVEITVLPPEDYGEGDPELVELLDKPDTTAYSLADDAGVCADIVKPGEGRVFYDRAEIDVEIMSPLGSRIELYVNNVPVGMERVGQKRIDIGNGTLEYIFYGVGIKEGKNDILVVCDEHGGKRNTCVRRVYLAGRVAGIVPEHEVVQAPADGKSYPEMLFLVSDANGLPVRDGLFATVTGPKDLIDSLDVNPHQPGIQVQTREGRISLELPPSRNSRRDRVHVSLEGSSSSCRVHYTSPLRDWFLFGYGDGSIGYGKLKGPGDTHRSQERYHDGLYVEGKVAFYGQGEIADGHLMTAAINTRPLYDEMLFKRIEPEKYYPIYGDASELQFNAASRNGTYIRLDHRKYSATLGDFRTDLGDKEFTRYHRSFNGLQGESRFSRGSIKAFITNTDQLTYQEEIRAEGVSGFYFLSHYPLVENSEKIRVEVRDRYMPERVLRVDQKLSNRDYDINYMDGSILFKEPVPATDESLNPVTIVVSYECRNSGEDNFIYGLRSSVDVTDSLSVGVTAVLEEEGVENSSLVGFDLEGAVYRGLLLESEYAHSDKFLLGGGDAFRIMLKNRGTDGIKWQAYYREIDQEFFNPSFSGGKTELGSKKYGGEFDYRISPAFGLGAKGYEQNLRERDEKKSFIGVMGKYYTGMLDGKLGIASASHSDTREGSHSSVLLMTGLSFDHDETKASVEWDQKLAGDEVQEYPNRLNAKLSRRLNEYINAVLRHEYRTGSRTGTRHNTQLGIESNVSENLHLFSRYRLEGAMSGERGQATIGMKNKFKLSPDLTATFSVEKLATVSGSAVDDFVAFRSGALYTPAGKDYRIKADYELRLESERCKHLTGLAGIKRMSDNWSALLKGDLWYSDEEIEANRIKGSSTLGFSLRPRRHGSVALLSLLRIDYEKNSPAHPKGVDREILSSIEANYPVNGDWELEGKIAGRWVENTFESYTASASTYLYQGQVIRIFGESYDVRVVGRIVHQRETSTIRYGGGIEFGRIMAENLWLGIGYDFGGHEDGDSPINDFESRGFHVRLRLKFSERLLGIFRGME